jgi:hypothetical protein
MTIHNNSHNNIGLMGSTPSLSSSLNNNNLLSNNNLNNNSVQSQLLQNQTLATAISQVNSFGILIKNPPLIFLGREIIDSRLKKLKNGFFAPFLIFL